MDYKETAYRMWAFTSADLDADRRVKVFHGAPVQKNWLRTARRALEVSTDQMADRLNLDPTSYRRFEKRECSGRITLEKLERAADALNCEVVYAIRPKCGSVFSQLLWRDLENAIVDHPFIARRKHPLQKAQVMAFLAHDRFECAQFRRLKGWTERRSVCKLK